MISSSDSYVEDNIIILPILSVDNNISRIGDLWDCQTSKIVGENLFDKNLDKNFVDVSPIQFLDYELKHFKSLGDRIKTFKIGGEMDLELLTGFIKVNGLSNFDSDYHLMKNVEYLSCEYSRETFSIYVKSNAENLINGIVKEKILNKEIRATHFVRGVILGARLNAEINIVSDEACNKNKFQGDVLGKLVFGRVNPSVKASLGFLDSKEGTRYSKRINVQSIPSMKIETDSIVDMFQKIDDFEEKIEKFNYFPEFGENLIGLPIRFILVPIKHFIDIKIEKLYLKMSENIITNFSEMMINVQEMQKSGYIVRRILKYNYSLIKVISDIHSPLHQEIFEYEKYLQDIGQKYNVKAFEVHKKYKKGEATEIELLNIINKFNQDCNSNIIFERIVEFIDKGRGELKSIKDVDIDHLKIKIEVLTSASSLIEFTGGDRVSKIWLHSNDKVPECVFLKFYEVVEPLMKFGFRTGVAIKSISSAFELCIKVRGITVSYKSEQEILYILSIISAAVGVGNKNEIKFHSMNAEIFNANLPFKSEMEMLDIHFLIENLKITKGITIAQTISETLHLITTKNDRWKCYIPLDAIKTSFLAVNNLRILMNLENFKNVEWVTGNLGEYKIEASGLLFFMRNGRVEAVCLDALDVSILIENFDINSSNITPILSPENMKHSLYPERSINVVKTIEAIEFGQRFDLAFDELYLKNFTGLVNSDLLNALELACSIKTGDDYEPLKKLAEFASYENSHVRSILLKYGYNCNEKLFKEKIANNNSKDSLAKSIEDIIEGEKIFSAKIENTLQVLNKVIETGESDNLTQIQNEIEIVLDKIVRDSICSEEIIHYNETYKNYEIISRCNKMKDVLYKKLNSEDGSENSNIFHTKNLHSTLIHGSEIILKDILKNYIDKIQLIEKGYGSVKMEFSKELEKKHYFQLICKLSECSHGVRFFVLNREMQKYLNRKDLIKPTLSLLKQLSDKDLFQDYHWGEIWKNNRFQYIMLLTKDEPIIINKLYRFTFGLKNITNMPEAISKNIFKLRKKKNDISVPEIIENFEEFTAILNQIRRNNEIPDNFIVILANSLIKSPKLFDALLQLDILKLFGYDLIKRLFANPLDINSIDKALYIINNKQKLDTQRSISENFKFEQFYNASGQQNSLDVNDSCETPKEISLKICSKFATIFGNTILPMNKKNFIQISPILEKPTVSSGEADEYFMKIIIYLIQKIKMWGCHALTADSISELLINTKTSAITSTAHTKPTKFPIFRKKLTFELPVQKEEKVQKPFSKFDAMVGIINSVDCIVATEIFNIVGKFPLALPLVIPNLEREYSYRCLLPLFTQINIKWSPIPGKIIENMLFIDKYKLIVTLGIGKAVEGKSGKSTFLNQILCTKNVFSSCGEPGGERGKPLTLDGSVEFIWLTQETSSRKLWESVLQNHYKDDSNELILLANLHGNCLEFEEILNFLKIISTSYIVFLMPDDYENLNEKFQRLLRILDIEDSCEEVSYLVVDPPPDCEHPPEEIIINSSQLASDNNIGKLRLLIGESLKLDGKFLDKEKFLSNDNLLIEDFIQTKESKELIKYIEEKTCASAKKCLKLQTCDKYDEYMCIWTENSDLRHMIGLALNVLELNLDARIRAMLNIEKELSRLSGKESSNARQEFIRLHDLCQRAIGSNTDENELLSIKNQLNIAMKNIDNINIGPEHFFREIGKLYEIGLANSPEPNPYENTAHQYAELLIAGHSIELLNGDSNSINGPWISAIFRHVNNQIPNLRIFVISILGLQSSGKSTLLNALFGCNFAVSVGRCTRGLFIRLLFLDKSIKKNLKIDAILLIDTEGLGAPERLNEVDAEKKDRLMATFAMSISHLTLVNIRGESMSDLTQILQIAIVAMTRLEEAEIAPDILIVQHLTERNDERITTANKVIGDALEEAINVAVKDNINLGAKNSKCLKSLRQTISGGNLFFKFRQFKSGASVHSPPSEEYHQDVIDLYNSILKIIKKKESGADLMQWNTLVPNYWNAVEKENFMRFKDVKDLQEFLHINDLISKLKESIVSAFRYHHDIILDNLAEKAQKINENETTKDCILDQINDQLDAIPNCPYETQCEKCKQYVNDKDDLYEFVDKKSYMKETHITISTYKMKTKKWFYKLLSQIINAKSVQKITSSNLIRKMETRLDEILKDDKMKIKTKEKYNENGINQQAEKIWEEIERETTGLVHQVEIKEQIINGIKENYENFVLILQNFEKISTLINESALSKKKWFKIPINTTVDPDLLFYLEGELQKIGDNLLEERKTEIFLTGMITSLKREVQSIILSFEESHKIKLVADFKWIIHKFALKKFYQKMYIAQKKWDKYNNPLEILRGEKPLYLNLIKERLKYGFSYHSDGSIAANCLLNAIKQRAKKVIDEERIEEVLKIDWLLSPISIRSEYFLQLAEQVKNGHVFDALNYFENPRFHIEKWFISQVNCFSNDTQRVNFEKTFKEELLKVSEKIQDFTNLSEIRKFIENYIYPYDGISLPLFLDPSKATKTDFNIFLNKIKEVLNDEETQREFVKKIAFMPPADDERVMNRLGCIESCPLCAALCWCPRGHENDTGETRKHHTCHQPMGLAGQHNFVTKELLSISCHLQKNDVTWYKNGEALSWSKLAKMKRYIDWKFEEHIIFKLNDMMVWFFFKLNEAIASRKGLNPAKFEEKSSFSFWSFIVGIKSHFRRKKYKVD